MKLKTATLLAAIGSAITILLDVYYLYQNFNFLRDNANLGNEFIFTSALSLISALLAFIFFLTLYQNQKNK